MKRDDFGGNSYSTRIEYPYFLVGDMCTIVDGIPRREIMFNLCVVLL